MAVAENCQWLSISDVYKLGATSPLLSNGYVTLSEGFHQYIETLAKYCGEGGMDWLKDSSYTITLDWYSLSLYQFIIDDLCPNKKILGTDELKRKVCPCVELYSYEYLYRGLPSFLCGEAPNITSSIKQVLQGAIAAPLIGQNIVACSISGSPRELLDLLIQSLRNPFSGGNYGFMNNCICLVLESGKEDILSIQRTRNCSSLVDSLNFSIQYFIKDLLNRINNY